jgi:hypothetical protein
MMSQDCNDVNLLGREDKCFDFKQCWIWLTITGAISIEVLSFDFFPDKGDSLISQWLRIFLQNL